ncbi:hypothetical protein [Enterovirga sp.]|uniref:hypothetical protein n=1 Tax=Enterovirga sp. TaxID=2026350 RepID=UPI002BEB7071|nr:hypothetical protein [Enterovirga sp.]HMO30636.1 hypothetical protein [Enterovirga sp.]
MSTGPMSSRPAPRRTCPFCGGSPPTGERERRRILRLLALFEHPDALPPDLALRLGAELLSLIESGSSGFRCDPA